ncbi:MAG: twin-arginine translocase TatA/TatE family subunit [Clostridia bacterium]|nr:twin-arginine translocase TatA/TatE family subunit [Clostridia bacterium]
MFGFNFGWTEGLIILGIALVIFGPGKLPQVGKALGESIRNFRKASGDEQQPQKAESTTKGTNSTTGEDKY